MKDIRERNKNILLIVAAVAIIILAIALIITVNDRNETERGLDAQYQRAYGDAMTDVDSLVTKLGKLSIAQSDQSAILYLMDVWRQTGDAESSISALPVGTLTNSFTQLSNRLGDYCKSLAVGIMNGKKISDEDMQQIKSLKGSLETLLTKMKQAWDDSEGYVVGMMDQMDFSVAVSSTEDYISEMYAKLNYDGPFSENRESAQPKGLTQVNIDSDQALNIARSASGKDNLQVTGSAEGVIPCFVVEGDGMTLYITKTGGHVLSMSMDRTWGMTAKPTDERYDQLAKIAGKEVANWGYPECEPLYAQFYNGCAVINVAPVQDGYLLYPDQIKVWVDIETEEVVGIDATNYLMSHTQRTLASPAITAEQAKSKVVATGEIVNERLALIPKDNGPEAACYEFTIKQDGQEYLVYINSATGQEEDLLLIKHINDGTLTE